MSEDFEKELKYYGSAEFFDVYGLEYKEVELYFDTENNQKIIKFPNNDGHALYLREKSFICEGNKVLFDPIFEIFDKRIKNRKY